MVTIITNIIIMRSVLGGSSGKQWGGKPVCRHHRAKDGSGHTFDQPSSFTLWCMGHIISMANLDQNAHYSVFIHIFPTLSYSYLIPRRTSRTTTTGWEWRSSEFSLSRQSAVSTSGFSWRSDQNLRYVGGKISPEQHHLGGDARLEIMISGATTTTSPRSRGETHSGAHRHRHHLPDMQPAQVRYRRVEPFIPTKISSPSSMSLSGWSSICTRCSSSTGSTNVENPHLADSQSGALCLDLSPTFFWSSSSYKIHSHAWSIGHNLSNNHQCRHTLVSTFVLGFASHVLLADITIFINANFFFTWAYFFSSKVVNSSANLFIYCAIGARYFFNAFCVKKFMSASLISLSNNHIFQKS